MFIQWFLDFYTVTGGQTGLHSEGFTYFCKFCYECTKKLDYNEQTVQINCENVDKRFRASRNVCKLLESILNFDAHKV